MVRAVAWVAMIVLLACGSTPPYEAPQPEAEPTRQAAPNAQATEPSADSQPAPIEWLLWHDIQGLMGGRAIYVESDGSVLARIVEPPSPAGELSPSPLSASKEERDASANQVLLMPELRHSGTLTPTQMGGLAQALHDADFLHMTVPDRPGIPDEARAVLVVRFTSGKERRLAKWEGVGHSGFDALNRFMRSLTDELAQTGTSERMEFDGEWSPEGPWPDPYATGGG